MSVFLYIIYIVIALYILMGITMIIIAAYKPLCEKFERRYKRVKRESAEKIVKRNLEQLSTNNKASTKAIAFVTLMQVSYVLIHTIVNTGNNYNDEKQMESFCKSLNPRLLDYLNSMEGKYE